MLRMKTAYSTILICTAFFTLSQAANAGIVVDHQPHPYSGPGSDTLFTSGFGPPIWQWIADDFIWSTGEEMTQVNFWGFYNADNPPNMETFRIRLYSPRLLDGLPGNVVHEEMIQNPTRAWTGHQIAVGILPREFFFEAPLSVPVSLAVNGRFWLEVVQVGDLTTNFRWETSVTDDNGHGYLNSVVPDWRVAVNGADQAFQLISPEPTSATLFVISFSLLIAKRSRRIAA